jgi:AcrR family transcriptional regulator
VSVRTRSAGKRGSGRANDAEQTQANILEVATRHFADHGLSGARIDEIAAQTRTSKRMIYYYFGSKEQLYQTVLERAYLGMRRIEQEIDIPNVDPVEALEQIVGFTFDYQHENPAFVRLVAVENLNDAKFIRRISGMRAHNAPVIQQLRKLLARGEALGVFRRGLEPVHLHWMISAFAVFNVSNEHTFSYLFAGDADPAAMQAARRRVVVDAVRRWCVKKARDE